MNYDFIDEVQRIPKLLAEIDLILEKHGELVAAFEINWSKNISGSHLSGVKAFLSDNNNIESFIVCNVDQSYTLDGINIINWKEYFDVLSKFLD